MKRRNFIRSATITSLGMAVGKGPVFPEGAGGNGKPVMLIRYDTEWWGEPKEMDGFVEKAIEIHRKHSIPVTFFCCGRTLQKQKEIFRNFHSEVQNDKLFDFQDHSYSHVGLCKKPGAGLTLDEIRADYEKSFDIHEEVFGKRPIGVALCGTPGESFGYFDSSGKTKAEFEMLAKLGIKMINTHLSGKDESREFCNYARLGHPEIMGFISGYSDTDWGYRNRETKGVDYMLEEIAERCRKGENMPVMLHDWVSWQHAGDKNLSRVVEIATRGRNNNYRLLTHAQCYEKKELWG